MFFLLPHVAQAAFKTQMQGQSFGDPTWTAGNLGGWKELDYIPCRVYMTGGPVSNESITIQFDHTKGACGSNPVRGIQNLTSFAGSPNVIITSGPTLTAGACSDVWSYTFTVTVTDGNPATVNFFTRLSSGAHLFGGSSLALSAGDVLQISKPNANPGNPNLALFKSGATTSAPGQTNTYTLVYTNRANPGITLATGVQIIDALPAEVTYVPGSATGSNVTFLGNSLTWDLGDVDPGTNGVLTYKVVVTNSASFGTTFHNFAQILSAETETDYSDNSSIVTTSVTFNRRPTAGDDTNSINEDNTLIVSAPGVLANDSDPDGNPLTPILVSGPTHGTLSLATNGGFTYTPAANYFGTDSFTYQASDGQTNSATATVTININSVNDAPVFNAGTDDTVLEDSGTQTRISWATGISAGAVNESGQTLNFVVANSNSNLFTVAGQPAINSAGTLTYTPAANAYGSATVTVYLHDNGGTANGGVDNSATTNFTITITPVNDQPSFTKGANQVVNEDAPARTVLNWATSISRGPNEAAQLIEFHVSNDNLSLFSVSGQPSIDSSGTLTFTPAENANGTAMVTVYLTDDGGTANGGNDTSATETFTITVNPVNDAPTFTLLTNALIVLEDSGPANLTIASNMVFGPSNESAQTGNYIIVSNSNPGLFSAGPSIDTNGVLTFTPAADANGECVVAFVLQDNGGTNFDGVDTSAINTFTITVNSVNDAPSFSLLTNNVAVLEDAGPNSVPLAASISAGPTNESSQSVLFIVVSNSNPSLFSTAPAVDATGILTFTSAADANGAATITLLLQDNGGTNFGGVNTSATSSFTITVSPVNDAPSFTKGANQTVNEDAGTIIVLGWATNIKAGPANEAGQVVNFILTNTDNAALFSVQPAITPSGALSFTPAANANGVANIRVELHDNGGTSNSGIDTSGPQFFTITVTPVNDPPSFTLLTNSFTVLEDSGPANFTLATNILAGPPNESSQTLSFIVTSNSNPGLFAAGPSIDTNGILTFTPATNANGNATVRVILNDNAGGASAAGTFVITVTPVNDAPSFTKGADISVLEDSAPIFYVQWASAIKAGPTNEASQTVTFTTTTNSQMFAAGPYISANGSLSFTPATNAYGSTLVTVVLRDNGGTSNNGVDAVTNTFTITIVPVNDHPTLNPIPNRTILEDLPTAVVLLTGITPGPANESSQLVTNLIAVSSDPSVIPNPTITYVPGDTTATLTYAPVPNANGTNIVIKVIAQDDGGRLNGGIDSITNTFTITVNPVNDPPTLDPISNRTVDEDENTQTVNLTGITRGPANESSQLITSIVATSSNPGLIPNPFVNFSGDGANATLTYQPVTDANGSAIITVIVQDNGGIDNAGINATTNIFTIDVRPVNDPPIISAVSNQTVNEDAPTQLIPLTGIAPGPTNEDSQTVTTIVAVSSDTDLIPNPIVTYTPGDSAATLSYTPNPDANGTNLITITMLDNGGTANGGVDTTIISFRVVVQPVNDPPILDEVANQTVSEDCGPQVISLTGISPGPANESAQMVTKILALSSDPDLIPNPVIAYTNGDAFATLTFTPAANSNGVVTITILAQDDGGTENGGVDISLPRTFTVTVTPVNDVPAFTKGPDVVVAEDCGLVITNWAMNIIPGGGNDEDGQGLFFTVSPGNPALFAVPPFIGPDGVLTFTPAHDANGSSTITVVLHDSGGADSEPQTGLIVVTPVNDAPSFIGGTNLLVNNYAGPQTNVAWASNIIPGPINELSQSVYFTVTTSNTNQFAGALGQPAITPNGTLIFTPSASTNGISTNYVVLHDDGGVLNAGDVDNSPAQVFYITNNNPPLISIAKPPTLSSFNFPASVLIETHASDIDGFISKVQVLVEDTQVAEFNNSNITNSVTLTNLVVGGYTLHAIATDNHGATNVSVPVVISVITNPVTYLATPMTFNPQTGLWQQFINFTNQTLSTLTAMRVSFTNVQPAGARVSNTNGMQNGLPFILYNQPVPAGGTGSVYVQFYAPGTNKPTAGVIFDVAQAIPPPTLNGIYVPGNYAIDNMLFRSDGAFLINFLTTSNKVYYIQYRNNLNMGWQTSPRSIIGNGGHAQWLDYGPPQSDSAPRSQQIRLYRVLEVPF